MKIHDVECPADGADVECNCRAQYHPGPFDRPMVDRLTREEMREWLDRKPTPKPVDEAVSTEPEVSGHDVHEPGCNCADCAGGSF